MIAVVIVVWVAPRVEVVGENKRLTLISGCSKKNLKGYKISETKNANGI
jgi:hypothetical protein